ncbi:MAG: arylsulfatase A-like enzyme [Planctomycetota bacterium]|jgi:arylsulfatase A-like enzyme
MSRFYSIFSALLLPLCACSGPQNDAPPHVLIVLVDTLRADHMGIGGYHRDTTPGIDALAKEGTVFANHFANAPWTKPSVASILTGLLPPTHGCQWGDFKLAGKGKVDILAESFSTLPEILKEYGYATHALINNQTLTPTIGFGQGFDSFSVLSGSLIYDEEAIKATTQILDAARAPTFIWCHLMAPHNYELAPNLQRNFTSTSRTQIASTLPGASHLHQEYGLQFHEDAVDTYDETVLWMDGVVTELIQSVREEHPNTIVVLTSDHGEEFGEHGGYLHSRTLFNELLRVPLVIWAPDVKAAVTVSDLTQSVDLLPTLLDLLELPPVPTQGEALFNGEAHSGELYAEKRTGNAAKRALITPNGKLIESKAPGPDGMKPAMSGKSTWLYFDDPTGAEVLDSESMLSETKLNDGRVRLDEIWDSAQDLYKFHSEKGRTQRTLTQEELEVLRKLGYVE